jgi:ribosomal protein S19E (S16A)
MSEEDEFDLKRDQWETLKALRAPVAVSSAQNSRVVLDELLALGLVSMKDELAAITPKGRKALIRGSFRLWDVAA